MKNWKQEFDKKFWAVGDKSREAIKVQISSLLSEVIESIPETIDSATVKHYEDTTVIDLGELSKLKQQLKSKYLKEQ